MLCYARSATLLCTVLAVLSKAQSIMLSARILQNGRLSTRLTDAAHVIECKLVCKPTATVDNDKVDLPTGSRDGSRIHNGLLCVRTSFSHMKKTGVTYRAYATHW